MVATIPQQRQDGRAGNELRPFACEQGALFRADGSARMSHGRTTVLAAVHGPGQARNWRSEKTDKATLDVCFKLEKGVTSTDKYWAIVCWCRTCLDDAAMLLLQRPKRRSTS